jgi:hypothetical protein
MTTSQAQPTAPFRSKQVAVAVAVAALAIVGYGWFSLRQGNGGCYQYYTAQQTG